MKAIEKQSGAIREAYIKRELKVLDSLFLGIRKLESIDWTNESLLHSFNEAWGVLADIIDVAHDGNHNFLYDGKGNFLKHVSFEQFKNGK